MIEKNTNINFVTLLINSFPFAVYIYNRFKNDNYLKNHMETKISNEFLKLSKKEKFIKDIYLSKKRTYLYLWLLDKYFIPIKRQFFPNHYLINKRIYYYFNTSDINKQKLEKRLNNIKFFIINNKKYFYFFLFGPLKNTLKKYADKKQSIEKQQFLGKKIIFYIEIFESIFIKKITTKYEKEFKELIKIINPIMNNKEPLKDYLIKIYYQGI